MLDLALLVLVRRVVTTSRNVRRAVLVDVASGHSSKNEGDDGGAEVDPCDNHCECVTVSIEVTRSIGVGLHSLAGYTSVSLYASDFPLAATTCARTAEGMRGAETPALRGTIITVPLHGRAERSVEGCRQVKQEVAYTIAAAKSKVASIAMMISFTLMVVFVSSRCSLSVMTVDRVA